MRIPIALTFLSLSLTRLAIASPSLDAEFGYRNVVAAVINLDKEPIYGEQVESDILAELRRNSRFEFSDAGYILLREYLNNFSVPQSGREPASASLDTKMNPLLNDLRSHGIQAIVLGELVAQDGEQAPQVVLTLYKTTGEFVSTSRKEVTESRALASYSTSARSGLAELFRSVPFEATVIRREGYNVVLDRGTTAFRSGQNVPVYTIEKRDNDLLFEETGTIHITRAETQLSFGKILVEKKPLEVLVGNKIRLSHAGTFATDSPPLLSDSDEESFSGSTGERFETTKGKFGVVNVNLLGSMMTLTNTVRSKDVDGNDLATDTSVTKVAPGIAFAGELWLTSRLFMEFGYKYAFGKMKLSAADAPPTGTNQSFSVSMWDLAMGYRLNLTAPEAGPILHAKMGFGGHSYSIEESGPVIFTSTRYSGLLLGGGITYQFNRQLAFGVDINSLVFTGLEETPVTTGLNAENVSAWQLAFRGNYALDEDLEAQGTVFFEQNGADFTGTGTRRGTTNATSQSTKGLQVGLAYYF